MKLGEAVDASIELERDENAQSTRKSAAAAAPSSLRVGRLFSSLSSAATSVVNSFSPSRDVASRIQTGLSPDFSIASDFSGDE